MNKYWDEIIAGAVEDVENSLNAWMLAKQTLEDCERRMVEDLKSLEAAKKRAQEAA